jgi:hypothetical protein
MPCSGKSWGFDRGLRGSSKRGKRVLDVMKLRGGGWLREVRGGGRCGSVLSMILLAKAQQRVAVHHLEREWRGAGAVAGSFAWKRLSVDLLVSSMLDVGCFCFWRAVKQKKQA